MSVGGDAAPSGKALLQLFCGASELTSEPREKQAAWRLFFFQTFFFSVAEGCSEARGQVKDAAPTTVIDWCSVYSNCEESKGRRRARGSISSISSGADYCPFSLHSLMREAGEKFKKKKKIQKNKTRHKRRQMLPWKSTCSHLRRAQTQTSSHLISPRRLPRHRARANPLPPWHAVKARNTKATFNVSEEEVVNRFASLPGIICWHPEMICFMRTWPWSLPAGCQWW